ncbi:MAG: c-type cytochrome biogenesis protein CcmI [Methylococcaceae bacterium]|nr:c-type cytochrome biogenesis protein CcmI [Methylococcaceae bacterium]
MIGFWILVALTLLVVYALFAPLLLGKVRHSHVDRQKLNLVLHQQRRAELESEFSDQDLAGIQAELDKDLLGDLAAAENTAAKAAGHGRGVLIGALVAAPLLGILLYSQLGRFDLADFRAQPQAAQAQITPGVEAMVERLAERLKKEPNDLKGWMLLGRSYQETEQFDKAVDAYRHALGLAPENLDIEAAYAEALGQSQNGNFTGEPAQIAAEILVKNPKHHNALWLAGAGAAQGGHPEQAIVYLETLRAEFPKGGKDDQQLSKLIADLKGGGPAQASEAVETGAEAGEAKSIRVKVGLAEALKAKANPEDTLFIFARAAAGPPMPLAIVRKQVKELPVEVALDDSMAMAPGMNLSAFDRVVIGARISKTGQALPKPGDLQGLTEPKVVENGGVYTVEIRDEVK